MCRLQSTTDALERLIRRVSTYPRFSPIFMRPFHKSIMAIDRGDHLRVRSWHILSSLALSSIGSFYWCIKFSHGCHFEFTILYTHLIVPASCECRCSWCCIRRTNKIEGKQPTGQIIRASYCRNSYGIRTHIISEGAR
jgi:hypothetical protein